jgi:cytosine/creatinine deaminase
MTVIPQADAYLLLNAHVPAALTDSQLSSANGLIACDLQVVDGHVVALTSCGTNRPADLPTLDLRNGLVLPRFVDLHTHLDKGHIWGRTPNPDGTFLGARVSVAADREARWSAADVRQRMDFALQCAFTHGTAAVRTHIDSIGPQLGISWSVFAETRAAWAGRISLQAVALFPTEWAVDDEAQFKAIVAMVATHGGSLGGLTFMGEPLTEKLDLALDRVMRAAAANGLDLDFHVDESDQAEAQSLERIALAAIRNRFKGRIIAGHCCSLALQSEADRRRVIERVGEAGIAIVALPMCNMYLQDRTAGRTPRWRGITPLHELAAAGVTTLVASDNTRDPFYAYGDLDMLEVFREATRIAHFDHSERPWARLLGPAPADVIGLTGVGMVRAGGPADLVLLSARSWNEANSRPQSDRIVLVRGKAISRTLPDYRQLDAPQ